MDHRQETRINTLSMKLFLPVFSMLLTFCIHYARRKKIEIQLKNKTKNPLFLSSQSTVN